MRMKRSLQATIVSAIAIFGQGSYAEDFNWRQFEGTTISALLTESPAVSGYIQPQIAEFEALTGIRVRVETLADNQARPKLDIILAGKDPSVDLFLVQMDERGGAYTTAGYLTNLEPFLGNPALTPADYDYAADFAPGCLATTRVTSDQPLNNIVFSAQAQLLHIRTDLFAEHGIKIPETLEELEAAAKALTLRDASGNVETYGFIARGSGLQATASFASYLRNFGGSWFVEKDGLKKSGIAEPEAIDALEYYGRLIREYAPPAALANRHDANATLFAAGKVAMLSELNYYAYNFQDEGRSRVAGKNALILIPAGPAGSYPNIPTTSFAISEFSKNKEATWLFVAWITGKEQSAKGQRAGIPLCRLSGWADPDYVPPTPSWGAASLAALEYGRALAKPPAVAINEAREAVGKVIDVAIRDGSREAILAEARTQGAVIDALVAQHEAGTTFTGLPQADATPVPAETQAHVIGLALEGQ